MASAADENVVEHGNPRSEASDGVESRSRYQVRSMSMPVIKPLGERPSVGTISRGSSQKGSDRHELRLPSFKALGIAVPHPDHLLTPPEEPDQLAWHPMSQPLPHREDCDRLQSFHRPTQRLTPEDEQTMTAPLDSEGAGEASNRTSVPQVIELVEEEPTMRPNSSSSEGESSGEPVWIEHAIDAVVSTVPASGSISNIVVTLCHAQPCPLSRDNNSGPNAFNHLITALQSKLEQGRFIEITYAVPPKFNMELLPQSPLATPNPTSGEGDYFSMNVFSKAVVAVDHSIALNTSVPSSPCRPIVPPSTVSITCLERFIPPSTVQEYADLFSIERPSVLVDRLTELSPNGGNLIFIYPTHLGATTFTSKYLNPLLDPLLRTMIQIHGLSADLGNDVGTIAAVSKMFAFEAMTRRISRLLVSLGRMTQSSVAQKPKYTLVQSSKERVELERDVWMEWWLHQEAPRIKEVMRSYFKRGLRLPQGKEKSESALVWEILDGVKARKYAPYDSPSEGIEVGVFVIKRTA
ncbi:MAG: hypothetical protein Q9195_003564 [Heterodermia aff. obscurata]